MLKTNVVKKQYYLMAECRGGRNVICGIVAESLESAKLKLPIGYKFLKEIPKEEVTEEITFIPVG